jgi:hypothetical protein
MVDSSPPLVIFNDIFTNSGLAAGGLFPVVHVKSKLLVVVTHELICTNIYSKIWKGRHVFHIPPFVPGLVTEGVKAVGLGNFGGEPASRNFTLDASPLFEVTIATTSPFDLSALNIVIITLKVSSLFPVSA